MYALALAGSTVYAGGEFGTIGGQPRRSLAALDAQTGAVSSWDAALDGSVYALAVKGSTLYAGTYAGVWESGDFGNTWTRVGAGPANPQIVSLAVLPEGRLLAGTFSGSAYLLSAPGVRETVVRVPPGNRVPRALPPRP